MTPLEQKLSAIASRSKMGIRITWDQDFQIQLVDNQYIDCDSHRPYLSGWHTSIEAAADEVLLRMDQLMVEKYKDSCTRIFYAMVHPTWKQNVKE